VLFEERLPRLAHFVNDWVGPHGRSVLVYNSWMKAVAIVSEIIDGNGTIFRAIGDGLQCTGKSAGEALDGLAARMAPADAGTLIVIQSFSSDHFFGADQRRRMEDLMGRWRAARDSGTKLPAADQAELEALTQAELEAVLQRTKALRNELGA
jgi:hypothetical protein